MSNDELVNAIYDHVLRVVNRILHNAKNYNISVLKLEDPSYADIAQQLKRVCTLMELVADDLPDNGETNHVYTVSKAKDYAGYVARIADAINDDDEERLNDICEELDGRPFT